MSEPGPESIPTSADPRSKRPTKRRAITPLSEHATQIETLFKDPSKEIQLPGVSKQRTSSSLAPPPEIVANVQGSSAGAGSGEFHVYKASRRRENERLRLMQAEVDNENDDAAWEKEREESKRKDEEKTDKNRRRREKKRAAKNNKKPAGSAMDVDKAQSMEEPNPSVQEKNADSEDAEGQPAAEVPGIIIHDED
ncbi:hypothetical protein N7462_002294 [Penicillium macrosclerotiorum]|uniref:uncharacterized protein n=1 Tax=Penicillium macrosclerotiorum TaxID=303699 RepID=UPI0025483C5E|nr:uncharacterized protein N7462_002294 [Penicillium macrosclerotiorum]KAJ5692871.1 hypothetical protein N7462_002294 [Penicillium macrosclerotiorum]